MCLEYLAAGSPECPLIRLFGFTPAEAARLLVMIADLAAGRSEQILAHELSWVEAVGGSKLVLVHRSRGQGVVQTGACEFECGLASSTWDNVAGLIEPFAASASGYQWLSRFPGVVSLLLSGSGQW